MTTNSNSGVTSGAITKKNYDEPRNVEREILPDFGKEWHGRTGGDKALARQVDGGALPENVAAEKVTYGSHRLAERDGVLGSSLLFDNRSCSLCESFYDRFAEQGGKCKGCPIYKYMGNDCEYVYGDSVDDPTPMVELLTKVYEATKNSQTAK